MAYYGRVDGKITSKKGFYIGDVCYALSDEVYDGVWGAAGYPDGIFEVPENGFKFAVAGTSYGDGCYSDQNGHMFPVDAGVIGLVPLELVQSRHDNLNDLGLIVEQAGEAHFEADAGQFSITLPDGSVININTADNDDYDEDEEETDEDEEEDQPTKKYSLEEEPDVWDQTYTEDPFMDRMDQSDSE